jgi:prophage antirepressor-like protein
MEITNFKFIIDGVCMATIVCIVNSVTGSIWFKAKEIAEYLAYKRTNDAIATLVDNEDKVTCDELMNHNHCLKQSSSISFHPQTIFINESGLYTLLMKCTKPLAKPFQRWVTSEVLPSIRKTGLYAIPSTSKDVVSFDPKILTQLVEQNRTLLMKYDEQMKQINDNHERAMETLKQGCQQQMELYN